MLKESPNIHIDNRPIKRLLKSSSGPQIELTDGHMDNHAFFAHAPNTAPNMGFVKSLNLELSESGCEIKTIPPFYETSCKGCFAVGDVGSHLKAVGLALAAGGVCAVGVTMQLF